MTKTMNAEAAKLAGLQIDFLQKLRNGSRNLSEFELFLNGKNPFQNHVTPDEVNLTLTITQSTIEQMIVDGKYDWANDNIVKKFQFDQLTIGEWEFKLVPAGKLISSEAAKKLCEADGFQAAKLEHLLVFGAMFPEEQKKNPVIALGSVCEVGGFRGVPVLWFSDGRRKLALGWWRYDWSGPFSLPFCSQGFKTSVTLK